jgi:general secretion pathway protein G
MPWSRKKRIIVAAFLLLAFFAGYKLQKIEFEHDSFDRLRSREAVLKEDLYTLRNAIDQYTQDKAKAPQSLDDIVSAGYLRVLPRDPFTNSNTSWQTVQEDVLESVDQTAPGITDVHSGSNATSTEGTAYSSW